MLSICLHMHACISYFFPRASYESTTCVVFPPLPARAGNFSTVDGVSKFALAIFRWTWSHHFQAARQIRAPWSLLGEASSEKSHRHTAGQVFGGPLPALDSRCRFSPSFFTSSAMESPSFRSDFPGTWLETTMEDGTEGKSICEDLGTSRSAEGTGSFIFGTVDSFCSPLFFVLDFFPATTINSMWHRSCRRKNWFGFGWSGSPA